MNHDHRKSAFTLIELLVVVAIIVALLAILLPSMGRAIAIAENLKCMSQMRQLGQATLTLTSDSFGQLPAVWDGNFAGPEPYNYSWLGKEVFGQPPFTTAWPSEEYGALYPYLGSAEQTVRELVKCPSLPTGTFGSGVGSNGFFDLTMVQALAGARISNVPLTIELRNIETGQVEFVGSRIFTEEEPAHGLNAAFIDGGHMSINRMGSWHLDRGGNYVGIDGAAHTIRTDPSASYGPQANWFWGNAPSGVEIPISNAGAGAMDYGWWNKQ
ncbi:MAG: type II secretion system protein [Proteobacteria bacterium]|nr:type II secretion system protein [Pseudomonadota bacterium]